MLSLLSSYQLVKITTYFQGSKKVLKLADLLLKKFPDFPFFVLIIRGMAPCRVDGPSRWWFLLAIFMFLVRHSAVLFIWFIGGRYSNYFNTFWQLYALCSHDDWVLTRCAISLAATTDSWTRICSDFLLLIYFSCIKMSFSPVRCLSSLWNWMNKG